MIDTQTYLSTFFKGTKNPSLDGMKYFMDHFDWCCNKLKIIHIAGTNGKGSVLETITSILVKQGYKVGKFLSPHLIRYNERISINNVDISDEELARLIEELKPLVDEYNMVHDTHITLFELETTMAFLYFYRNNVDFAIMETGLGGLYDCTNIISKPIVSMITSIGFDHMHLLGNTLPEIAAQKAGIIKEDSNTVFFKQEDEINKVFIDTCKEKNNKLFFVDKSFIKNYHYDEDFQYFDYVSDKETINGIKVKLKGKKQINNTLQCIKTIEILKDEGYMVSDEAVIDGIATVVHKGRMEKIHDNPKIIYDGAHNAPAMENFLDNIEMYYKDVPRTYIVSILKTKDHEKMLKILSKDQNAKLIFTSGNDINRYNSKETLYDCFKSFGTNHSILKMELQDAIKLALNGNETYFVIGSFYVYGDVLELIK